MNDEALRYPTGRFTPRDNYSTDELGQYTRQIESLPSRMASVVDLLTPKQLDTAYRDGGWTARQVIHHVADSHMNAYIRFKWTLTEDNPVIKAYNEKLWAETPEAKLDPHFSLDVLKALHAKWTALMKSLSADDLKKSYIHPDTRKHNPLERIVAMYAWHGDHHLAHLKIVAEK